MTNGNKIGLSHSGKRLLSYARRNGVAHAGNAAAFAELRSHGMIAADGVLSEYGREVEVRDLTPEDAVEEPTAEPEVEEPTVEPDDGAE